MQKSLIALATAAVFVIVGYFVYAWRRTPCDGIFEQTVPSLSVKVNALKASGEWVIGPEKVQDVSDGAQKIAVHLKSCCISQQSGYMRPEQYQVCVNGAKDYEAKIIQITNIIGEAQAAKQDGKSEVADQKVKEARTAAAESTSIVSKMAQAEPLPTSSPPAAKPSTAKQYFFDDFKGKTLEELGDKWEIIRPDADNYALEKDGLLIINSKVGHLDEDNIPNLFRLKTEIPEGDWTATVKFSSEFPAANEAFYLALLQDKENWTAVTVAAHPHWIWDASLPIGLWRKSANDVVSSEAPLFAGGGESWNSFISNHTLGKPIYLRLRRAGHDFIASGRLENLEPDTWVTLNKIAELRVSGNLVFGFAQASQGTGQTQVKVEWVKIETP
jgi:hypothetical protein